MPQKHHWKFGTMIKFEMELLLSFYYWIRKQETWFDNFMEEIDLGCEQPTLIKIWFKKEKQQPHKHQHFLIFYCISSHCRTRGTCLWQVLHWIKGLVAIDSNLQSPISNHSIIFFIHFRWYLKPDIDCVSLTQLLMATITVEPKKALQEA